MAKQIDTTVPSESKPGTSYRVKASLFCECWGFTAHGHCKHIRAVLAQELGLTDFDPFADLVSHSTGARK